MSRGSIALLATGAAALGAGVWYFRDKSGSPLLSSAGTYANPLPMASSDAATRRIPGVAARLKRLWPEVTGESEMPKQALEIALSQAWLESGVAEAGGGGWWTDKTSKGQGNMVGSGNLGARQCGGNDKGGDYYTCVPYGDSMPQADGSQKQIDASFRFYKAGTVGGKQRDAGDAAAYDFLVSLVKQWPALAELKSGDVLAYAMRQGPKYRPSDAPNQKVFGREYKGGNNYYGGFGATMEERVGGYARAIASHIPAVAAALGHDKVYSRIVPEILSGKQHIYTKAERTMTAGVEIEGAGTVIAAIAGILVTLGIAVVGYGAGKAIVIVKRIHDAGIIPIPPNQGADRAYVLSPTDPALVAAVGNDAILKALLAQGWTFQRKATSVAGESDVTAHDASASDAYARRNVAGIEGAGTVAIVVATGLVGGALAAAALKRAKEASAPTQAPPPVPAASSAPKPQAAPKAAPPKPAAPSAPATPRASKSPGVTVPDQASGLDAVDSLAKEAAQKDAEDKARRRAKEEAEGKWRGGTYHVDGAPIEGTGTGIAIGVLVGGGLAIAAGQVHKALDAERKDTPAIVPEPPPPIPPSPAPQPRTYTVKAGDSPFKIAAAYGASKRGDWWKELAKANPQKETKGVAHGWKQLLPGESIIIPADWPASASVEGVDIGNVGPLSDSDVAELRSNGIFVIDSNAGEINWPDADAQEKSGPSVRDFAAGIIGKEKLDEAVSAGILFTNQRVGVKRSVIVKKGDTPWKIAQRNGGKGRKGWWAELRRANPNKPTDGDGFKRFDTGDTIVIPAEWGAPLAGFDDVGEVLQALHIAGALPRARAIPGSDGHVVWYVESLGKAKKEERSGVDDAIATGTDATTAATGILSAVDSIKNIVKRHGVEEDPKARLIIKAWVEKHPILARLTSPDLRPYASVKVAGVEMCDPALMAYEVIGGLAESIGDKPWLRSLGVHSEGFIVAGVNEIAGDVRAEIPIEVAYQGSDLRIPIVVHEVGDADQPIGAVQDDIYNVASNVAAGFVNFWVPGAGTGIKKASDAVKHKIDVDTHHDTGEKKPKHKHHKDHGSAKDKAKIADLQAQLAKAKAKIDVVREYVTKHRFVVRWTKPNLAIVTESESAPAPDKPADKGSRTKGNRTALGPVVPAETGTGKGAA